MDFIKMAAASLAAAVSFSLPALAGSEPSLGYMAVDTPYGAFGCKQRAEQKLYAIGATGIHKSGSGVFGYYGGTHTIGLWCRGTEVIIVVSGSSDVTDIRSELKTAF
jgi:hypothetical protein